MSSILPPLHGWVEAIGILAAMFVVAVGTRYALKHRPKTGPGEILHAIAPGITNIILILAFKAFLEAAPVQAPKLMSRIDDVAFILFVFVLMNLLRQTVMLFIEWGASRTGRTSTLQQGFLPLTRNLITLFVLFMGSIMVLQHFGQDVMSLITALGVSSLAVGLAAKDTLSNMISGFTLIIDRNLKPGDRINLAGTIGDVEEIGLRSTRLRTGDGNTLIVPNSELVNTRILNLSLPSLAGTVSAQVRLPLGVPFTQVQEIFEGVMKSVSRVNQTRGCWVNLASLFEGNQIVAFGFWVDDIGQGGSVLSEVHQRLVDRLRAQEIPILGPPTPWAQ